MPRLLFRSEVGRTQPSSQALALLACLSVLAFIPHGTLAAQSASGSLVGTVEVFTPPPRRTANRYASGRVQAPKRVQLLPVVVYLVGEGMGRPTPSGPFAIAQQDTAFAPPVLAVQVGAVVEFPNEDPFFHNVFSYSGIQRFDLGRYPLGQSKSVTFNEPGVAKIYCEVHDFMRAAVLVLDTPHFAIVAADGSYSISGIAPGDYELRAWHADLDEQVIRVTIGLGSNDPVEVTLR